MSCMRTLEKKEMLFVASILLLGLQCVIGAPQLRLSHTGYEIISFNDQTPDDSLPAATKLTLQNASRYNGIDVINLDKGENIDDETDGVLAPSQHHKRHYDHLEKSIPGSKINSENRRNSIDPSAKESSSKASERTNVYPAVVTPTRFEHPSRAKESSDAFSSSETTSSNVGSRNSFEDSRREKISPSTNNARINEKKMRITAKSARQSIGNQGSDKSVSPIFDNDFDLSDPKEEDSKLEKMTNFVADAHRALDLVEAKSESEEKLEKIEAKSIFPVIGKQLPSFQIHRQRSFYLPSKSPAMFSPIYPSGFDVVTGNFAKKSILPVNEPPQNNARNRQFDSKNSKNSRSGMETSGSKEFAKSRQKDKIPSLMMLKNILSNMKHDVFNPRNINGLPISGLLPVAGTSLYVSPLSLMLQNPLRSLRPSETHLELNSMPLISNHVEHNHHTSDLSILHPQDRLEEIVTNSMIDSPKTHQPNNYLDSKINRRIAKLGPKTDFFRNYFGKMNSINLQPTVRNLAVNQPAKEILTSSSGSSKGILAIDILRETTPEDSEETVFDINKEDATKEIHETHDTHQAPSSSSAPKMSCKWMKPSTPPFYQFLAKFGDILLENALKYEKSLQVRDSAVKLIEAAKKNSE